MVNDPNALLVIPGHDAQALVIERNVFKLSRIMLNDDLLTVFIKLRFARNLGNLYSDHSGDWIINILDGTINSRFVYNGLLFLGFFTFTLGILSWCFRSSILEFTWCSAGEFDLLDPTLQFTGANVSDLGMESIKIPETIIDEIEDLRVELQLFLMVLHETQEGTSKE